MDLNVDNFVSLLDVLHGQNLALTFYHGRSVIGRLTYDELREHVLKISYYLENDLGVRRGDRVLILSPNRLEIPVLLLAVFSLGAVVVPLNPNAPAEDWNYIAKHSGARGLILSPGLQIKDHSFDFKLNIENLFQLEKKLPEAGLTFSQILTHELAIVLYTSGTTGNPKGIGLSQNNLFKNAASMALNFELYKTTQFSILPLYHAHALGFGLMTALSTSGHLVFTDKMDPFAWAEIIRNEAVAYTSVVPSFLPMLVAARVHKEKVPSLKSLLVSSAPLTTEMVREFETKTSIPLIHGWGLSEYTNFACCLSLRESASDHKKLLFEHEVPSVGSPLTGTEVKIIDVDGNTLGEAQLGELCVRGHSLMMGYYCDPETTKDTILDDGWLRTGDLGMYRMHRGKPVFFIAGRIKEIIIRSGEKYNPLAIEKKICHAIPELQGKIAVLGFNHKVHGEEIGAYIEIAPISNSLPEKLRDNLTKILELLPIESRPKVILYSRDPIPRTHTGKIQRRKLKPLYTEYFDFKGTYKIIASH